MSKARQKPVVAITIGDPAGIGPEVVLKALVDPDLRDQCVPLIIGDLAYLEKTNSLLGLDLEFERARLEEAGVFQQDSNRLLTVDLEIVSEELQMGAVSPAGGKASGEFIKRAVDLCQNGVVDAMATIRPRSMLPVTAILVTPNSLQTLRARKSSR